MVLACCLKSAKTIKKMKDMISEGITEKEWTEKLIQNTFENGKSSFTDLDVISSLVKQLESGPVGKLLADKVDLSKYDKKIYTHLCMYYI